MSALYNLRVGGVEAEDIICNGQTVEEVWVDGVQVYDAYDPAAVPNGEGRNYSANLTGTYENGLKWFTLPISVKATGSMSIKINSVSTPNIANAEDGLISTVDLVMWHPKYGQIASVEVGTITNNENQYKRRDAYAYGGTYVVIQSGGGEIGNYATLSWDFHNKVVQILGNNYAWNPKWTEGITMQYQITPCSYKNTSGDWVGATMSCTYSITA